MKIQNQPLGTVLHNMYCDLDENEHKSILKQLNDYVHCKGTNNLITNNVAIGKIFLNLPITIKYNSNNMESYCLYISEIIFSPRNLTMSVLILINLLKRILI